MNNQQFILLMVWVCFVSAYVGYTIGGVYMAIFSGIGVPATFLYIGD